MLKKAGIVTAGAVALSLVAAPAFAAPTTSVAPHATVHAATTHAAVATQDDDDDDWISFAQAYHTFIFGGGAVGAGLAALAAGAYTGIITTPSEFIHSLQGDDDD